MPVSTHSKQVAAKVLLAAMLLSLLAGVAGSQLAPKLPLHLVLLYSALGVAALFALLALAIVARLTFVQFIMRKGGTDPQWLWFQAEPPGLVELRRQARESKEGTTRSD